jgi:hypothetical protein
MAYCFRTSVLALAPLAVLLAACTLGGGATGDLDHIQVTMSQFEISVKNISGRPLTDVVAEIEPVGPGSHFVAHIDTLNSTETRTLDHGKFRDRDSVPFSPRNKKAKAVIVTGVEMDGKPVRVSVPFTM